MKADEKKTQEWLDRLVERAHSGEKVSITSSSGKCVELRPVEAAPKHAGGITELVGAMKGEIHYTEGWDAPLSANEAKKLFAEVDETETPGGSDRQSPP
ncbi:hypothetical protein QPM17_22010 [Marinobacter sp. TBZ242]|uniref:Type II toxin-antitoxin system prevent-host-death family antitoxin n=1 Tax=Marinobacter azerbaijanicus TaxID=3050455 RepID=A0ABT7II15_9GAMM|nr:hypothetical protein [Marinobacter sp. TBZ242]MDL0433820.1 hypothetical protein [Marinobacter sp. TBZ242]